VSFTPDSLIRAINSGVEAEDFTLNEAVQEFSLLTPFLTVEELADTQTEVQSQLRLLIGLHEAVVSERILRNPPNQTGNLTGLL